MEVFIPFTDATVEKFGLEIGRLVPFQLEYKCFRIDDAAVSDDEVERTLELLEETA